MEAAAYITVFLMGLSYGSTACMLSCAPLLSPLLVSNSSTLKQSMTTVGIFSAGRVFSYSMIALSASYASLTVKEILNEPLLWGRVMGVLMILTALYLFYTQFQREKSCCVARNFSKGINRLGKGGYFFMGAALSFNFCAPVLSLAAFSAGSSSKVVSLFYGFLFGIGAVMVSFIFYGFILSSITKELLFQFSRQKKWIETAASALLFAGGVMVLLGILKL
ncbi:sulfite exporter TauE/SafE family protein [Nitrosophilus alvini]|uniref:sulfite exporter TauE/SafE family protein n=1 Tax=Nitrosophilus alvini TaxID=2714855 RepID=UPI00190C7AE1|nr:sulfite exporter TauE/SafE family protein [Nitrosophilus alvini]